MSSAEQFYRSEGEMLNADYDGHNMVFVVGCPRSGTTWLQRLLASHPKIHTGQESFLFSEYIGCQLRAWRQGAGKVRIRGGRGLSCYFTEEEFLRNLKPYMTSLLNPMVSSLAPDEFFVEKTPDHALYLREIIELLPRAHVIHIVRDARDVVSSLMACKEWNSSWAISHANIAADWWVRYIKAVRDVAPKMPPNQFLEVRYEDVSSSPVEVLQHCVDFLELDWDGREIAQAVETNRAPKVRANGDGTPIPLYGQAAKYFGPEVKEPTGFIRKAKPGSWREDLSLYQKFRVWRVARDLMDELGYDWPKAMKVAFAFLSAPIDLTKLALSRSRMSSTHQLSHPLSPAIGLALPAVAEAVNHMSQMWM